MSIKEKPQQIIIEPEELLSVDQVADKQQQEEDLQLKILSILDKIEANTSAILRHGVLANQNSTVRFINKDIELIPFEYKNNINSESFKDQNNTEKTKSKSKNQDIKNPNKDRYSTTSKITEKKAKQDKNTAQSGHLSVQPKNKNKLSDTKHNKTATISNHKSTDKDKEVLNQLGTEKHQYQVEIRNRKKNKPESSKINQSETSNTKLRTTPEKRKSNSKENNQSQSIENNQTKELDTNSENKEQESASQEAQQEQKDKRENSGLLKIVGNMFKKFSEETEKIDAGDKTTDAMGTAVGGSLWGAVKEVKEAVDDVTESSLGVKVIGKITGKNTNDDNHTTDGTSTPNTETQSKGRKRDKNGRFISGELSEEPISVQNTQEIATSESSSKSVSSEYQNSTSQEISDFTSQEANLNNNKDSYQPVDGADTPVIEVPSKGRKRDKRGRFVNKDPAQAKPEAVRSKRKDITHNINTKLVSSEYQNDTTEVNDSSDQENSHQHDDRINTSITGVQPKSPSTTINGTDIPITEVQPKNQNRDKHDLVVNGDRAISIRSCQQHITKSSNTPSICSEYPSNTYQKTNNFNDSKNDHRNHKSDFYPRDGINVPITEVQSKHQKYDKDAHTKVQDNKEITEHGLSKKLGYPGYQDNIYQKNNRLDCYFNKKDGFQNEYGTNVPISESQPTTRKHNKQSYIINESLVQATPLYAKENVIRKSNTKSIYDKYQKNINKKPKPLWVNRKNKHNDKRNSDINLIQNTHEKDINSIYNKYSINTHKDKTSPLSGKNQQHHETKKSIEPSYQKTNKKSFINHINNVTSASVVKERKISHSNDAIVEKLDKQLSQSQKQHKELIKTIEKKKLSSEENGSSLMDSISELTDMFGNGDEKKEEE
ncbi:hypothetical protein PXH59_00265 (plasmid) [Xenorhabdus sp. SF857]|uniref:hypothetical protein n=1 Tax=Xenorhabdus bakwenae TaxID=3026967 RepID=UPI002557E845|nr:hypothetical protein [Xenorhabdus sp. SF857]WFQ78116.1 hypothetical protein PXH59_00265 [Xenorhabdus sp. SF857]